MTWETGKGGEVKYGISIVDKERKVGREGRALVWVTGKGGEEVKGRAVAW